MKFAVVTLGSAGDLHPFLAVARELVGRGHDVRLLSQAPYARQSLAEGVPFVPVVDAATHHRTLEHPLLWHPIDGFGVLWRHLAVPAIKPVCEALGHLADDRAGGLTVLASPLAVGARFARERWPDRVRLLSGYTAPMGLRSVEDPMFLGAWRVPPWLPAVARESLWRLLDRWKLEPMAKPAITQWQRRWSTQPVQTSIFGDWLHSPDGGVALYPSAFAAVPERWQRRGVLQAGFPLFEPRVSSPIGEAFDDFIARHPQYVLLYPGSAAGAAERFDELVLPACDRLAMPCIVLGAHLRHPAAGARSGASVLRLEQAPLRLVLSRAAAFVHHGGIGSLAHALTQRVPQLVLASAYDQFENGSRLHSLGAGQWLRLASARSEDVRRWLVSSTVSEPGRSDTSVPAPCGAAAVAQIVDLLERTARTTQSRS